MATNLPPLIAPRMEPSYTHPTAQQRGTQEPKKSPFCSAFARQLCDDNCLPGWLLDFSAPSQASNA